LAEDSSDRATIRGDATGLAEALLARVRARAGVAASVQPDRLTALFARRQRDHDDAGRPRHRDRVPDRLARLRGPLLLDCRIMRDGVGI
jgi:hypothetical protein